MSDGYRRVIRALREQHEAKTEQSMSDTEETTNLQDAANRMFLCYFNWISEDVNENAKNKGFWDDDRHDGIGIALIHSELSEALESIRKGHPPDHHCPEFTNTVIELADAAIRIMDLCEQRGWPLAEAILAKHAFNLTREHRHGGKAF